MNDSARQVARPMVRRRIYWTCLNTEQHKYEFLARVDAVQKCGLIAEVEAEGSGVALFAVRRPVRRDRVPAQKRRRKRAQG